MKVGSLAQVKLTCLVLPLHSRKSILGVVGVKIVDKQEQR